MANMKLFFVLGAILLCGVATVVRCEEEAVEVPQPEDTVEDEIEEPQPEDAVEDEIEEQVDDDIEDEDESNDKEDEEGDDEEEEDEDDESADPSKRVVYSKTYTYVSKPVVYTSHQVVTSHHVVSSSSTSHVVAKKCGGYTSLGCWKDTGTRAIPSLDKELGGGNYKARGDAINKCFKLAAKKGMNVFGVQDGGWCAGTKSSTSYKKYGPATNCNKNGKGGGWANNVYRINRCAATRPSARYVSIGCWKDTGTRAIPSLDKAELGLGGNYKARADAINKCFKLANSRGMNVFGVQDGGWCAGTKSWTSYKKYGQATNCSKGKGGGWANNVYKIIRG